MIIVCSLKGMVIIFFILCMYVDDLGIFCNNHEMHENSVFKIKDVFELHENDNFKFLGMEIVKTCKRY